jgi:hypothetical protein
MRRPKASGQRSNQMNCFSTSREQLGARFVAAPLEPATKSCRNHKTAFREMQRTLPLQEKTGTNAKSGAKQKHRSADLTPIVSSQSPGCPAISVCLAFMQISQELLTDPIGPRRGDRPSASQRPPSLCFTHGVATGTLWAEHLRQKCPESDQRSKEPLPSAPLVLAKERVRNELAQGFAQLRNRISALGLSLQCFQLAARGPTKKQGTQSREKRSGRKAHIYAYIYVHETSSLIL